MLGAILALISATTFALTNAFLRRGVLTGSVMQAMAITVPLGGLMFLLVALVSGLLSIAAQFPPHAIALLSASGIIHFVVGRYCNFRAVKAMGAVLVGPVIEASLVWTIGLAVLFLGETLTPLRIVGIALITFGPMVAMRRTRAEAKAYGAGFKPNRAEGTLFALLCAACYGTSPILVRAAMPAAASLGAGLAGGMISYLAAATIVALVLLVPGQWRHARATDVTSLRWFTLSGFLICISQMMRYMALAVAPVIIVAPIQRTAIIFRLLFARLINPEHEIFGSGVMLATVLCGLGILAISFG